MPLSEITVTPGPQGLGLAALSKDGVSGIVFYNASPSGFATNNIIKIFSISEAENLGIVEGGTFAVEYYHINEFFRANPKGELYVGFFATPGGTYDFVEIQAMQSFANGEIRLMGVYAPGETYADTQIAALQTAIDAIPSNEPIHAFLASDLSGITAITGWGSIADLRTQTAQNVSYVACQDGGAAGKALYDTKSYTLSTIGRTLGDTSFAAVNQSIGEVGVFNISNGNELEIPAMGNGDLVSDLSLTALGSLKDKGYSIIRKRGSDIAGTYNERTPSCIAANSDFAFIENDRVIQKATRLVIQANTPYINTTVQLNEDGTLTSDVVGFFEDLTQSAIETNMTANGEISNSLVVVDPNQDIAATSTLKITVSIQPTPIAEFITIEIGLVAEI
jgi:hypothetical protein